ncbi:restriction endonuclease subunit S [Vibrio parahaemolyticus]|uniref:restriction endonuclease subunit S n=1 Tax=Vibrio parahaemolyticus TaxID=670 RepID=UPI00215C0EBD|nr:restriction endonuclease subunit S [Vibrio parahaemolyticus]MCR9766748.1 restriction endonuclease subunit S [Vibrio parahaemolyticus]
MSHTFYLDKLLDGVEVERKNLDSIFDIFAGGDVPKDVLSDIETKEFNIPILSNGIGDKAIYGWTNTAKIKLPSLTISARGTIGWTNIIQRPFFPIVRLLVLTPKVELNLKYAYHYMKLIENNYKVPPAGIPQLTKPMLNDVCIPIPCPNDSEKSLAIQAEIVRILDAFTAMTAELTAELNMRKKQYNYYRNQLLSFDEADVEWKSLGELAENLDSKRKPITSGQREPGNIPYYGASGIVDYVKDFIFDGDFLLVSEDGANLLARNTPIAFSISGKNWVNNHAHVLKFETYAERRYVEYYLNGIDLTPYISGAAQPKLNKKNLSSISIPNPSLEEKERIVSVLDKFHTLTTSISDGLPREIELRQKQYEYYRGLLLSFPKQEVAE